MLCLASQPQRLQHDFLKIVLQKGHWDVGNVFWPLRDGWVICMRRITHISYRNTPALNFTVDLSMIQSAVGGAPGFLPSEWGSMTLESRSRKEK